MLKVSKVLMAFAILALAVVGCQKEPISPMAPMLDTKTSSAIGPGATMVTSATLHLFTATESTVPLDIHRVTSSWQEMVVTWNNFGGAFDATIWTSFTANTFGWKAIDITSIVQAWADGTYPNYGMLLDKEGVSQRSEFVSSEAINIQHPWVEICTDAGCDTIVLTEDTYINENEPATNFGLAGLLSGVDNTTSKEKQILLWFPVPTLEDPVAAIGDRVWYDNNLDGIQNEGEAGVPGVTVQLFDCLGNLLAEMLTDANGWYLFENLPPGDYHVKFSDLPAGYVFTSQNQGGDDTDDSDADPLTGETICTNLVGGETDRTWDAGIYMPPSEGCSHTIGYWKTHAGIGSGNQGDEVSQYLPIWLGTAAGAKSRLVNTAQLAVNYLSMNVYGTSSNGITKLYGQLLGAKLSIADGAADGDIAATIAAADAFLALYDYTNWTGLTAAQKTMVIGWKDLLDQYNNGLIGPGHCDEGTSTMPVATTISAE